MPSLATLREKFRAGMNKEDFFAACDGLLEDGPLEMSLPAASEDLVAIKVDEGDRVLFFLTGDCLRYAEYRGDVFLGE